MIALGFHVSLTEMMPSEVHPGNKGEAGKIYSVITVAIDTVQGKLSRGTIINRYGTNAIHQQLHDPVSCL
jgi:hypothetical protein